MSYPLNLLNCNCSNYMPDVFVNEEQPDKKADKSKDPVPVGNQQSPSGPLPFFSAYCRYPEGIQFQTQETNEQVVLFLRRHFTSNISWIITSILLILMPVVLIYILPAFNAIQLAIPTNLLIVFIGFYYLIVFGFILNNFIIWFYNVGIITNRQIIDIDFTDIMYREIAKARIQEVIDVEFTQGGVLESFFDFGDVFIQTEGVKPNFEFSRVPHPDHITDIILDLKGKA